MRARFTKTDSEGNLTHQRMVRTIDGERVELDIASTGTIQGPKKVIEALIEAEGNGIEPFDETEPMDQDEDEDEGDADAADSDADSDDEGDGDGGVYAPAEDGGDIDSDSDSATDLDVAPEPTVDSDEE